MRAADTSRFSAPDIDDGIFVEHDPRFRDVVLGNCALERLYAGTLWCEGPVYFAEGDYVVFSDIPNDRLLQWIDGFGTRVLRAPSNNANGNTRDREGRLVTCEHLARRVTRTEADGSVTVLADRYRGRRLNSPNDVVVHTDGSIWFTDPTYGILSDYEGRRTEPELDRCHVFRLDPHTGALDSVVDDFAMPNGLAFSPDESILYVADSGRTHDPDGPHHIRSFEVGESGALRGGAVFAEIEPGIPDGMRIDVDGNVWTSAGDGVHCIAPEGGPLGRILVPEKVANLTFGGRKRNRLFIAATTSLYAIYVGRSGAQRP